MKFNLLINVKMPTITVILAGLDLGSKHSIDIGYYDPSIGLFEIR